jgi:hypothetical protein
MFVSVPTGQAIHGSRSELGVGRATVVHVCRTDKQGALDALAASVPGRPDIGVEHAALAEVMDVVS